ncbi:MULTISPECIES: D-alanyl-D-alanine carboxypeptidase family protein [Bacillus]|uniref:Peptidase S11 D-alanyl-D-alanine carboxypeptidase A N-terminal domain-containing protein n=10 Tax=Bacillus cereus group TaxID=86661 RepID=A0A9W5L106_BACCE|nr:MULTISPECIES: D-alanyl-D-alanine carboxypeptidase family protein [Bacillus]AEA15587.1 D-alanyl-D-alanine carboxypeptidase [Bacillus thuringiensis serovar chinensis CT-43]AFV17711.1 D-alanyl-D-alanine carboxypeptidase DacA [Bacillus thuringiensis Bt407]AGG00643.1 D-alanyl-D-alanine carboxypeptidase [Bacillus thuringiensis serovar thuringiensis str. IS5056]AKR09014.1 D-alanyl-D-alanine carboxypeptidase [Bacillus thuringiensis]ARP57325.1 D-alanyl-D-alanine carboxypeptidase [Bacillus thuringien
MNRLKWGRMTVLLVIILGICWFLFQGNQKSVANVEGQPLQVAELPKAGFTEKVVPPKYIPPEINAKAAMIIDASDGDIIYQYNENEAFAPASMSKMMTAYLLLESIHNGKVRWEDPVKMSAKAAQTEGARIPVQVNDTLTVKDLYHALMIESANNSAVALAEHMAKSEKDFVQLMDAKAKQLKMSEHAKFANASGLQEPDGSETKMTAADVAQLAYHLIKDYPEILEVTHLRQSQLAFNNINVISTNDMLNKNNKSLYIEGMDGLKTGFTDSAGYCFTGTAKQGDNRIITVVMGTSSKTKRFTETNKLMSYAFGLVN